MEDAPGEKTLEVYHGSPTGVGKIATRKRRILMIISSKWSSKKWGDLPNKSLLSLSLSLCMPILYIPQFLLVRVQFLVGRFSRLQKNVGTHHPKRNGKLMKI